jgi:hypothetical protein
MKIFAKIGFAFGFSVFVISGVWAVIDMALLYSANAEIMAKNKSLTPSEADYLYSRELTHRLNVGFEGVWAIGGMVIMLQSLRLHQKS